MLGEGSGDEAQLGTLSQSLAQDFWRVLSTLKAQTFKSKGSVEVVNECQCWKTSYVFSFYIFFWEESREMSLLPTEDYLGSTMSYCTKHRPSTGRVASRSWAKELSNPFRNLIIQRVWKGVKPACALLNLMWCCCADGMCSCFPAARIYFSRMSCGFLTCMCYTVLQKSQKSSRYDALPHCPCKSAQGMCLKSSKHTLWRDRSKQKLLRTDKQQACSKDDVGWRNSFPVNRVCLRSLCQKSIESNQLMVSTQVLQMIMSESSNQVVVE